MSDASNPSHYDTIVVGGGLVGLACAIGLAQQHVRVAVIERIALEDQAVPAFDGRVSALSHATHTILNGLGVWESIAPHSEPILDILVAEQHRPATVHFDHKQTADGLPMGYMVENRYTRMALAQAAKSYAGITLFAPAEVAQMRQDAKRAQVQLADGQTLEAPLLVVADGKYSALREQLGVKVKRWEYGQHAVVLTVQHEKPHHGLALERFFPAGPFAALPMQDTQDGAHRSAIVWTVPSHIAPTIMQLSEARLLASIEEYLGEGYGRVSAPTPIFSYPLMLQQADAYAVGCAALVGDTAHAVHPIAGQGVNLGYRDVALLLKLIKEARSLGLPMDQSLLARYSQQRQREAKAMIFATDALNRLFSNAVWPLPALRHAGLGIFEQINPLKRLAVRYAMGMGAAIEPLSFVRKMAGR